MDAPNVSSVEVTDMNNALLYLHVLSDIKRFVSELQFFWF